MMNSARPKTALNDLKSAPFAQNHAGSRHADVLKSDLSVAVGGIVVAVNGEDASDLDARGVGGDEHDGLLSVDVGGVGRGFAHHDVDFAAGVAGAGGPPFLFGLLDDIM